MMMLIIRKTKLEVPGIYYHFITAYQKKKKSKGKKKVTAPGGEKYYSPELR